MAEPQVDKHEIAEKMLLLAVQYRQVADSLSVDAFKQLKAGTITREDYGRVCSEVETTFAQAVEIHRAVSALADGALEADLSAIESAAEKLKDAVGRIEGTRHLLDVSLDTVKAIGVLVLACANPTPASIATAVQAAKELAGKISG